MTNKQRIHLALTTIIILIWFGGIETLLSRIPNSYILKHSLMTNETDAVIVSIGDSHSQFGIDPSVWPVKGINLANASQSLWYDAQIVHAIAPRFPKLKVIMLPLSYYTLWYDFSSYDWEAWRQYFYTRFMFLPPSHSETLLALENYSLLSLYTPQKAFAALVFHEPLLREESLQSNGARLIPMTKYETFSEEFAAVRIKFLHGLMVQKNLSNNRRYLDEIIEDCKKYHIRLLLVTMPQYHLLAAQENPEYRAVISQTIADRVDNVTVFSYDALQDPQYDSSDFYDIDHLRDTGAAHFSRVIYNESMKQLIDLPK